MNTVIRTRFNHRCVSHTDFGGVRRIKGPICGDLFLPAKGVRVLNYERSIEAPKPERLAGDGGPDSE